MSGGPLWGGGDSEENRVLPTAVRYLTTSLPQPKEGQMHTQMCSAYKGNLTASVTGKLLFSPVAISLPLFPTPSSIIGMLVTHRPTVPAYTQAALQV